MTLALLPEQSVHGTVGQHLIYVRRSYKEATAADVSDEMQEAACRALVRMRYRTWDDFERLYDTMPGPNYGWFQCKLHVAARRLVGVAGGAVLARLWDAFRVGDTDLAGRLRDDVHPELATIAHELRAR